MPIEEEGEEKEEEEEKEKEDYIIKELYIKLAIKASL
jgi:hypothetical protein